MLVTIMTSRTNTHLEKMTTGAANAGEESHLLMEASIQGINDAYFTILLLGFISLVLSFFIKRASQASGEILDAKEQTASRS
ncbi:hypothetical protein [Halalkalibacter oceani]|uniref:hypothetical protein n=1 Tax=Halalkalibacter oceani TaxID=1653776 RepID=UPI00203C90D1|nr:hypothetical protein [Halalkalibacter oceani]MCM3761781.1 hypothetical protein [Halalkalibacter oceani]